MQYTILLGDAGSFNRPEMLLVSGDHHPSYRFWFRNQQMNAAYVATWGL